MEDRHGLPFMELNRANEKQWYREYWQESEIFSEDEQRIRQYNFNG